MNITTEKKHYTAEEIIKQLGLQPLIPEGGWYKFMYKSEIDITKEQLPSTFKNDHGCASYIYYLLKKGEVSDLHMLSSDEIWFWLAGGKMYRRWFWVLIL